MSKGLISAKDMAQELQKELDTQKQEKVELSVIEKAKQDLERERDKQKKLIQEAVGEQGYIIAVPDTEVILYEDDGYQLLYCNNIDAPGKVSYLMAMKKSIKKITGRTPITSQGYVAQILTREVFTLILSSHHRASKTLELYQTKIDELEKELKPLRYIQHLITEHNLKLK